MDSSNFKLMSEDEIKDVLDKDLLDLLDAQGISEEQKTEFYQKMTQAIQNRVIIRIDNRLNDSEREQWLELIDKNDHKEMEDFLKSKNIEVAKLIVEEAIIYKMQLMSLYKQVESKKSVKS
ncbi:TPA: hypothetical protein DD449_04315 [Candidatus Berkelbacteria bacterium]|uniref:Uncharacterized protein n=1 Tax=Berkelbacteria bacterium GW2011_GWE1_39_12 TaxID=1618337 RepID=A0A0G4B4G1_9BACT|nr:MAG: hypothetical protein UT28_C0001G0483 [Berkelbacteria bacterium GW2011_GWE1_39_12]HBO60879.1 hypothetical protein [Candidatus Berkelbacteria bacterium]